MKLILASASPRRRELLAGMGLAFEVCIPEADESFDPGTPAPQIPEMLARRKAQLVGTKNPDCMILAADTVVECGGEILNKPLSDEEAFRMLEMLSGREHRVHTGYCLLGSGKKTSGTDSTSVWFRKLESAEIWHYIRHYQVRDKAGSYGIQDWIGLIGVERIEGSYFTVMGLPTHRIWEALATGGFERNFESFSSENF